MESYRGKSCKNIQLGFKTASGIEYFQNSKHPPNSHRSLHSSKQHVRISFFLKKNKAATRTIAPKKEKNIFNFI